MTESLGSTDVVEGGPPDAYTMALTSQPAAEVVITVNTDGQTLVAPRSLTFTSGSWHQPQVVTVTAVDDDVDEGPHTGIISHTVVSIDSNYHNIQVDRVIVNIADKPGEPGDYVVYLPLIVNVKPVGPRAKRALFNLREISAPQWIVPDPVPGHQRASYLVRQDNDSEMSR
jgi:hypothetical protein